MPRQLSQSALGTNKTSTNKRWGLGLVFIGLGLELNPLLLFVGELPDTFFVLYMLGVGLSALGLTFYARAQESRPSLWWSIVAVVFMPFVGPLVGVLSLTPTRLAKTTGMVLVLAFIGVVLIAIPKFWIYQLKARQSYFHLYLYHALPSSADKLRKKNGTYAISDISQLEIIVDVDRETSRYSYWYSVNGIPTRIPLLPGASYREGLCDVTTPPTSVKVTASATGFTAAAKGNIDDDATCDEWSINEEKQLVNTLSVLPSGPVEVWMQLLGIKPKG